MSSTSTSSDGGLFIPLYPWVPREPGSWRRLAQLRRDVNTLYHLRHPRLVSLMGAVWDSKIEPVLVFESMDGGAWLTGPGGQHHHSVQIFGAKIGRRAILLTAMAC